MNIGQCLTVRIQDESCEVPQAADKTLTQRLLCLSPARKPVNGPRTIDDAKILFFRFPTHASSSIFMRSSFRQLLRHWRTSASTALLLRSVSPTRSPAHRPPYPTLRLSPCVGLLGWRASGTRAQSEVHADTRHRGTSEGDRRRVGGDVGSIATEADNPAKNAPRYLKIGSSNC